MDLFHFTLTALSLSDAGNIDGLESLLAGLTRDEYVSHNALDDAIAQAWTICKCYERLGLVE